MPRPTPAQRNQSGAANARLRRLFPCNQSRPTAATKSVNSRSRLSAQKPSRSRAARSAPIRSPIRQTRNPNQNRIRNIRTNNVQKMALNVFSVSMWFTIEHWYELSDGVTRKNGHCNVAIPPRPVTRGDSADSYCRQQQQRADRQGAHESGKKPNYVVARIGNPKCQATKRQYPGNHSQAPAWQPQPTEAGECQPDDRQQNKLLGNATQLRSHADPRTQRQAESDQQNGGNDISASACQTGMKFRQTKHQDQRARYSQHKSGESPPPRGWSSGDRFANRRANGLDNRNPPPPTAWRWRFTG